ncbi:MAG: hypothetical protein LBP36_00100 [Oscillospiraceae bacterium]|nr:hypothetical protein [Oscillospiraceae bacterium]
MHGEDYVCPKKPTNKPTEQFILRSTYRWGKTRDMIRKRDCFHGRMPNVFLADEVGDLPNNYAVESMRSSQINILNKLGCVISTKYPIKAGFRLDSER